MSKQTINIGVSPNDNTGTPLRDAFDITNDNFNEIYALNGGSAAFPSLGTAGQVVQVNTGATALEFADAESGVPHIIEGTNFTDSIIIGHETTGTLINALRNTALGLDALDTITQGDDNVAIGYSAATALTTGSWNTFLGSGAGEVITTGSQNVAVGYKALSSEQGYGQNVAVGYQALQQQNSTSNRKNTAVGYGSARLLTTGSKNVTIGHNSGDSITTGSYNVLVGNDAGSFGNVSRVTAIGYEALYVTSAGTSSQVGIGYYAGRSMTTGIRNVLVGSEAGQNLTTGSYNIAIGYQALNQEDTRSHNVAIGYESLKVLNASSDGKNIAMGSYTGNDLTTGTRNVLIGHSSGDTITTGSKNIIIGADAAPSANTTDNEIVIGDAATGLGANTTVLGNSSTVITYIRGDVGIGLSSPTSMLHVKETLASPSVPMVYFEADRSASAYGTTNVRVDNLEYGSGMKFHRNGTYGSTACSFQNDSNSTVGSITIGASSTAYNTTSDYRLKENISPILNGIDRLKQLEPKRFNFIGDTSVVDGFLAHEAKEVVPEAVTGEKDQVLPNGDPIYQGIDQGKLVPLLTAALQEAITKIEQLETRVETLENA